MRLLALGIGLTVVVAAGVGAWFGPETLPAVVLVGGLATAIQIVAVGIMRRGLQSGMKGFFHGVGAGVLLRLVGVAVWAALVYVDRGRFPPLPTAIGFLGVLIPLLFLEVRFLR